MAQNSYQYKRTQRTNNTYVYGNTVRKMAVVEPVTQPQKKSRPTEEQRREALMHQKELQQIHRVNLLYTVAVVSVLAFIFVVCVQYLQLQASVKSSAQEVANMETYLSELTLANDEAVVEINGSINYDAILDVAVNQLGMVYPNKGQVVQYTSGESQYVKQFQDIPSAK